MCGVTEVQPGGSYSLCTDKIGCRAPGYKTSNDTINNSGRSKPVSATRRVSATPPALGGAAATKRR